MSGPSDLRARVTRRTVLAGLGAFVALPPLLSAARATVPEPPRRFLVFFVPNGLHMPEWNPVRQGGTTVLGRISEPLRRHLDDLTFVKGLRHVGADLGGIDPHGTGVGPLLTGVPVDPTRPLAENNAKSADQMMADFLGVETRFPSLDLSSEPPSVCDTLAADLQAELPCHYVSNISWRGPGQPVSRLFSPRAVFERLFGGVGTGSDVERARRIARRQSVLDTVLGPLSELRSDLPAEDRDAVDAYLTQLRAVEQRLDAFPALDASCGEGVEALRARVEIPPADGREHVRLMLELATLAVQCDQTRVVSYMLGNGASGRSFPWLGIPEAHHILSHHGGDPADIAKIVEIDRWEVEEFANWLDRLAAVREADGSRLLDNTVVMFCAAMGDGDSHDYDDLPIALAGGGRGLLRTGRILEYSDNPNINGLLLALLQGFGAPVTRVGIEDAGPLPGVLG